MKVGLESSGKHPGAKPARLMAPSFIVKGSARASWSPSVAEIPGLKPESILVAAARYPFIDEAGHDSKRSRKAGQDNDGDKCSNDFRIWKHNPSKPRRNRVIKAKIKG